MHRKSGGWGAQVEVKKKKHSDTKYTFALTLRRNVSLFHFYEFECDHHQICTQQQLPSHEAK